VSGRAVESRFEAAWLEDSIRGARVLRCARYAKFLVCLALASNDDVGVSQVDHHLLELAPELARRIDAEEHIHVCEQSIVQEAAGYRQLEVFVDTQNNS
jgi:hypothetical protein